MILAHFTELHNTYSCKNFTLLFFSLMKHRVVGTCCKNLTQIRQLYCCCNSRGKEGSLKDGFYPKLSGSWGHCFHHHLLNSQYQKFLSGNFFQKFLGWSPGVPRLPIIHLSALLLSSFAYPLHSTHSQANNTTINHTKIHSHTKTRNTHSNTQCEPVQSFPVNCIV